MKYGFMLGEGVQLLPGRPVIIYEPKTTKKCNVNDVQNLILAHAGIINKYLIAGL